MPRLYRPAVPVQVKVRVVLRQLGDMLANDTILWGKTARGGLGAILADRLEKLAALLNCDSKDLRLDHDPPLGARPRERRGLGKKTYYTPDANDPDHLFYRPHGAQFAGSHDVKTRIRGEHGQLSDIALVKKNRRLEEKEGTRPKSYRTRMREKRRAGAALSKPDSRKVRLKSRGFRSPADKSKPKRKWPTRPLRSANRWPKRRGRKL